MKKTYSQIFDGGRSHVASSVESDVLTTEAKCSVRVHDSEAQSRVHLVRFVFNAFSIVLALMIDPMRYSQTLHVLLGGFSEMKTITKLN